MLRTNYINIFILAVALVFSSCSSDDDGSDLVDATDDTGMEIPNPELEPSAIDLSTMDNGSRVMMQAFYWDVEPRFAWWDNLSEKVPAWSSAGIDRIWLPVASKGQSGGYSMGYDVSDYYDFGDYEQHGTVETRFGSRTELENLISTAHENDMEVIADIVINHNSGGGLEYNPYREYDTYTLFNEENGNASGMFNRTYEDFYPNSVSQFDPGSLFYEETNLDHHRDRVQDWLWRDENSVAKYYKNVMGFDGWRFDYVLGFEPWVVKAWLDEVGGFSVVELWDGSSSVLEKYVEETGAGAFDFATFYNLEKSFDRLEDLTHLTDAGLWQSYPEKAVTFTANHDTEKDSNEENNIMSINKMKAYAFILTHPGYPTIFYSDYENDDFKNELNTLIAIHNSLATGETEVLYVDNDEYVMKRNGSGNNPGLILYISLNNSKKRRTVPSNWSNTSLHDYSSNSSFVPVTNNDGDVTIEAPANGYSIWSITE